jgi:hypothetical protein
VRLAGVVKDLAGRDVEGGEQIDRSMPFVVMGVGRSPSRAHRQRRLSPIQRLDLGVGSGQGAVSVFRLARFPGPPAEPDVPVSEHPALHRIMSPGYAAVPSVWLGHGEGMVLPR